MSRHCLLLLLVLACCLLEISSRPNNEAVEYLPFYGGGKGQYLEVKTDNSGIVVSERIISEDKISSENIIKLGDDNENLLSKVLAANLQNLRSQSSNLLKLHTQAKRRGELRDDDKSRFKTQLSSLGETASNTIKLVDEIGDNVEVLYKRKAKDESRKRAQENIEDVVEEGIGIEASDDESGIPSDVILGGATIAEAKPVGLAVVGENGLAASRPQATAVAASGVAIARPIGTAIAGLDPTLLGINFQVNNKKAVA